MEDSDVIFKEIDIDNGGTVTVDELYQFVVDKMVGIPYTYRSQINKTLRKVQKVCDKDSTNVLNKKQFNKMVQFVVVWFRIYLKFKNMEEYNKNWQTDETDMKKSGLGKLVEGKTFKDKIQRLTGGKREDLATFQDQIEQATDAVTKLLTRLVVPEVTPKPPKKDRSEELNKLNKLIEMLKRKIAALENQIKLLLNDLDLQKEQEIEVAELNKNLKNLEAEKLALQKQIANHKQTWEEKIKKITDKNNELLQSRENKMKMFNDWKTREEKNLAAAIKELNNQIDNLEDQLQKTLHNNDLKNEKYLELLNEVKSLKDARKVIETENAKQKLMNDQLKNEFVNTSQALKEEKGNLDNELLEKSGLNSKLCGILHDQTLKISNLKDEIVNQNNLNRNQQGLNEAIRNEFDTLQNKSKNYDSKFQDSFNKLKKLEELKNKINSDKNNLISQIPAQKSINLQINRKIIESDNQIDSLKLQNNLLNVNLEENKQISTFLDKELAEAKYDSDKIQKDCASLEKEVNDVKFTYQSSVKTLQTNKTQLNDLLLDLYYLTEQENTNALDKQPPIVLQEQNSFNSEVASLASTADSQKTTLEYMKQDAWIKTTKKLSELDTDINKLIGSNFDLSSKKNETIHSINELKLSQINYNRLKNTIDSINKTIGLLQGKNNELKDSNNDYNKVITDLQKESKKLEEAKMDTSVIDKMNKLKKEKQAELDKLNASNEELRRKLEELTAQLDDIEMDNSMTEDEKQRIQDEINRLIAEKNRLLQSPIKIETPEPETVESSPVIVKFKKDDRVDELLAKFMNTHDLRIKFTQISTGKQKQGSKVVNLRIFNDHVMVRVGGGWKNLEDFVSSQEEEEVRKMKFLNIDKLSSKIGTPKSSKVSTPKSGLSSSKSERTFIGKTVNLRINHKLASQSPTTPKKK